MSWSTFITQFSEWWPTITCIVSLVFVLYYGLTAPWYKTPFGRTLIAVDLGLFIVTLPTAVFIIFGVDITGYLAVQAATVVCASGVTLAIVYRIITLYLVRHSPFWKLNRHDEDDPES